MGSKDNTIGIQEEKSVNYENVKLLKGHEKSVRGLSRINDNYFSSGSFDKNIKIWDLNKQKDIMLNLLQLLNMMKRLLFLLLAIKQL